LREFESHGRRLIAENYPRVAAQLLEPLFALLTLCRKLCGGDCDKFLVLLQVALRAARHPMFRAHSYPELIKGDAPVLRGLGTNVRSIAEAAGIPRETARRKVGELVAAGWLERRDAKLYFTAHAYQELAPALEQLQFMAARYADLVHTLDQETT
jgi:hypothetical protein